MEDAKNTLLYADNIWRNWEKTIDYLNQQKLSDRQVLEYRFYVPIAAESVGTAGKKYANERGYESEVF